MRVHLDREDHSGQSKLTAPQRRQIRQTSPPSLFVDEEDDPHERNNGIQTEVPYSNTKGTV